MAGLQVLILGLLIGCGLFYGAWFVLNGRMAEVTVRSWFPDGQPSEGGGGDE